jgi:hypothetical protein
VKTCCVLENGYVVDSWSVVSRLQAGVRILARDGARVLKDLNLVSKVVSSMGVCDTSLMRRLLTCNCYYKAQSKFGVL